MTTNLEVLARIAGGLCREASIARVVVSPDDRWSWNGATRTLSVGERTLAEGGPEVCAGIVAHEVGHAHLSRHLPTAAFRAAMGEEGPSPRIVARWLNAIEDPRVEAWMARRFPGVGAWLAQASRFTLGQWSDPPSLRHEQWAIGACIDDDPAGQHLVDAMLPEVRAALDRTRAACHHYRDAFLPPTEPSVEPLTSAETATYEHLHCTLGLPLDGDDGERRVRLLAAEAWLHATTAIFPTAADLFRADVEELASVIEGSPEVEALAQPGAPARGRTPDEVLWEARVGAHATAPPSPHARWLAEQWLSRPPPPRPDAPPAGRGQFVGLLDTVRRAGGHGVGPSMSHGPHDHTVPRAPPSVPTLVNRLERALREALRAERQVLGRRHAHDGARADLRRVMANEAQAGAADGRKGPQPQREPAARGGPPLPVWRRPVRARHDAAFALLIDCSGSMRGERIAAAVRAADVFVQALDRVGAPYLVSGFQDRPFALAPFGVPLREARAAIAQAELEVRGRRPGGNNRPQTNDDGPCILATADLLLRAPARQRVLVVLCDGRPAARPSSAQDLRDAVTRLSRRGEIDLVGVGLGPEASHVRDFYPRHVVVPRAEDLPEQLVRVLGG